MPLGDNPFAVGARLLTAFEAHAVTVPLTPSEATQNVPRDIYMRPLQSRATTTVQIVVSKAQEVIDNTEAGGKPKEVLEFFAQVGAVNEGDEIAWNGHTFRTTSVWPLMLGGNAQLLLCRAEREVDR